MIPARKLTITRVIKPLSVNQAWCGKRFKTPAYKAFEQEVIFKLPYQPMQGGWYKITYLFYLIHWQTSDADNFVKVLQDCLVKKGIIKDDRFIMEYVIKKIPSDKDYFQITIDRIELEK